MIPLGLITVGRGEASLGGPEKVLRWAWALTLAAVDLLRLGVDGLVLARLLRLHNAGGGGVVSAVVISTKPSSHQSSLYMVIHHHRS
jgi:hypothetical protein